MTVCTLGVLRFHRDEVYRTIWLRQEMTQAAICPETWLSQFETGPLEGPTVTSTHLDLIIMIKMRESTSAAPDIRTLVATRAFLARPDRSRAPRTFPTLWNM
jgi:hypothetical protein